MSDTTRHNCPLPMLDESNPIELVVYTGMQFQYTSIHTQLKGKNTRNKEEIAYKISANHVPNIATDCQRKLSHNIQFSFFLKQKLKFSNEMKVMYYLVSMGVGGKLSRSGFSS